MSYIHAAFVLPFHLSCKLLHIDQYTWENNSKIKENGAFSIHDTSVPSEYLHQILQILNKYNYRVYLGNPQRLVSTKDCHFFLKFFS